ncbi:transcription antitermination factor NusB [Eubacteriaceae bacterium ES3]|nr:transcription antitermination factor NusB [Eubacteriaceae bacterium ES3]
MSRKKEREYAFKGIFQLDFHPESQDFSDSVDSFLENEAMNLDYGKNVIETTKSHLQEIDGILDEYLKETWQLDRIPKIEKSILRMAICELVYIEEKVPYQVIINEAIELTKKYGDENGRKYVNGILNQLVKDGRYVCPESWD